MEDRSSEGKIMLSEFEQKVVAERVKCIAAHHEFHTLQFLNDMPLNGPKSEHYSWATSRMPYSPDSWYIEAWVDAVSRHVCQNFVKNPPKIAVISLPVEKKPNLNEIEVETYRQYLTLLLNKVLKGIGLKAELTLSRIEKKAI